MTASGVREWCICGHHDGNHDMEGDETQPCSGPSCICEVWRPTGQGMPQINELNAHGTGLEASESSDESEELEVPVVEGEALDDIDEDIEKLKTAGNPDDDGEDDDG